MPIPRRSLDQVLAPATNVLATLFAAEPWMADALCAQVDPELFFPDKGGSTREAKQICRKCTVSAECLIYALDHEERFGIWGGMSERDRRKLKTPTRLTRTATIAATKMPQPRPLLEEGGAA